MNHHILFSATGGPEVLQWMEGPLPEPGPGEVRVRHTAIGVNYIDVYHRSGAYPMPLPAVPGLRGRRGGGGPGTRRDRAVDGPASHLCGRPRGGLFGTPESPSRNAWSPCRRPYPENGGNRAWLNVRTADMLDAAGCGAPSGPLGAGACGGRGRGADPDPAALLRSWQGHRRVRRPRSPPWPERGPRRHRGAAGRRLRPVPCDPSFSPAPRRKHGFDWWAGHARSLAQPPPSASWPPSAGAAAPCHPWIPRTWEGEALSPSSGPASSTTSPIRRPCAPRRRRCSPPTHRGS